MKVQSYEIASTFRDYGLVSGRMLWWSKSEYRELHKGHEVYFNCNIFTKNGGKIWWGDLDLTLDADKLQKIADYIGEDLFVLRELDGRFENEERTFEEMKKLSVRFFLANP